MFCVPVIFDVSREWCRLWFHSVNLEYLERGGRVSSPAATKLLAAGLFWF
jgi:hypothetical protein